ncbi:tail fiber domain-containing protein [Rosenbergiella epipactidis]|uniref:tail fiber domain-containing protein n=1 Tax=Rosenbergiella epipactidis TaxID=1544694 RepID=UPI001F4DF431|nr:tail fiber domain-containing protein [Rosenbergiella epipactidis]
MAATGTIALNANSLTVTGSGTKFTSEAQVGGALVTYIGNVPYTFVIDSIASDTALNLTTIYQGSNVTEQSFSLLDRGAYTGINAELGARTALAIRKANYDKMNWQQLLTVDGDVTVKVDDYSQYTGPSWLLLANSLKDKASNVDLEKGLEGKLSLSGGTLTGALQTLGIEMLGNTPFIDFHYNNDSSDFNVRLINDATGLLTLNGNFRILNSLYFGSSSQTSIRYAGGYLIFDGGPAFAVHGYRCVAGRGGASGSNSFNYFWTGGALQVWIDTTNIGTMALNANSDKGLKKNIEYLGAEAIPSALEEVNQWKPATFKYKERGIIPESDNKLGFVANDLVAVSPACVTGKGLPDDYDIDSDPNNPDAYQLDQVAMIAKLTMAVQELTAKVETLEKSNSQAT